MGNTRYYTLCEDKDRLIHVLSLILHHNTAEYEDVGEPLEDIQYMEISDSMKALASKAKRYAKFKSARFLITSFNGGGRNSTRPFFENRGVNPDENCLIPQKAMDRIDDHHHATIEWKRVFPAGSYKNGGLENEELSACIREEIDMLLKA